MIVIVHPRGVNQMIHFSIGIGFELEEAAKVVVKKTVHTKHQCVYLVETTMGNCRRKEHRKGLEREIMWQPVVVKI